MATDIVDKDLKALRNARWKRAFDDTDRAHESPSVSQNRKATIVIEHLIQASDVAHTSKKKETHERQKISVLTFVHAVYCSATLEHLY